METKYRRRIVVSSSPNTDGASELVELPFVVAYMADLGRSAAVPAKLSERSFVEITKDGEDNSFAKYIAEMGPETTVEVPDQIFGTNAPTTFKLKFEHIDDFSPRNIIENDSELRKIMVFRNGLLTLMENLEGNDDAEAVVMEFVKKIQVAIANSPPAN